jgi:hypothetical protein
VPLSFVEIYLRCATMTFQLIPQPVRHLDRPRGILSAVADEDWTTKPFNLYWRMFVIETFEAGGEPRYQPTAMKIDTS